ncbi:MAG: hypothetical protein IKQ96_09285 [Lachnospiraceae bacterium]|nr:hypothetical protein [Lachnospiraceae bacterium]
MILIVCSLLGLYLGTSFFLTKRGFFPRAGEDGRKKTDLFLIAFGNLVSRGLMKAGSPVNEERAEERAKLFGGCALLLWAVSLLALMISLQPGEAPITGVERSKQGGEPSSYSFVAVLESGETVPVSVEVAAKERTKEEREALFDEAVQEVETVLFAEGDTADCVRHDLTFPGSACGGAVKILWQTEDKNLVGYGGTVYGENAPQDGRIIWISARLYCEDAMREKTWYVCVYPPVRTQAQSREEELTALLSAREEDSREDGFFELPEELDGMALTFYPPTTRVSGESILLWGLLLTVLLYLTGKEREKERQKEEKRQMETDYPEILMKISVLLGAGIPASGVITRITDGYRREKKSRGTRAAYEGMIRACMQMQSGVPEGEAYLEFGRSTGLHGYLRMASLLEQSVKSGSKGLAATFRQEAREAFLEEKNRALRQGEEAETRFLLPMLLLLGITLILILTPAIRTMGM